MDRKHSLGDGLQGGGIGHHNSRLILVAVEHLEHDNTSCSVLGTRLRHESGLRRIHILLLPHGHHPSTPGCAEIHTGHRPGRERSGVGKGMPSPESAVVLTLVVRVDLVQVQLAPDLTLASLPLGQQLLLGHLLCLQVHLKSHCCRVAVVVLSKPIVSPRLVRLNSHVKKSHKEGRRNCHVKGHLLRAGAPAVGKMREEERPGLHGHLLRPVQRHHMNHCPHPLRRLKPSLHRGFAHQLRYVGENRLRQDHCKVSSRASASDAEGVRIRRAGNVEIGEGVHDRMALGVNTVQGHALLPGASQLVSLAQREVGPVFHGVGVGRSLRAHVAQRVGLISHFQPLDLFLEIQSLRVHPQKRRRVRQQLQSRPQLHHIHTLVVVRRLQKPNGPRVLARGVGLLGQDAPVHSVLGKGVVQELTGKKLRRKPHFSVLEGPLVNLSESIKHMSHLLLAHGETPRPCQEEASDSIGWDASTHGHFNVRHLIQCILHQALIPNIFRKCQNSSDESDAHCDTPGTQVLTRDAMLRLLP
mmetsp:Transcript_92996/g.212791  ORF Transcript_92996/g.212791 Transcript_92996/m.212791 type:complete len:527 (-) Transcript_92996:7-1587(-)